MADIFKNVVDIGTKESMKEIDFQIDAKIKLKVYLSINKTTPGFYKIAEQELVNINKLIEDYMKGNKYSVESFQWSCSQEESNG